MKNTINLIETDAWSDDIVDRYLNTGEYFKYNESGNFVTTQKNDDIYKEIVRIDDRAPAEEWTSSCCPQEIDDLCLGLEEL